MRASAHMCVWHRTKQRSNERTAYDRSHKYPVVTLSLSLSLSVHLSLTLSLSLSLSLSLVRYTLVDITLNGRVRHMIRHDQLWPHEF